VKFDQGPSKEGVVTGGTGKKVKINGKEVAVVGSTVSTCTDTGAKDNSVIMAPGASMPMPVIKPEEYAGVPEEVQEMHP
jgi:uncharacterized Zn-binding protein involved in type VI secretion